MEISASMVKDLREKTGAGMLDCKKALAENGGDFEKSVEWLRKKGIASAAKKAGRATKEGLVSATILNGGRTGVVLETNCETDFVARTDQFRAMIKDVSEHIAAKKPATVEEMNNQPFNKDSSKTVNQVLQETIATLGENMSLRRFALYEAPANGAVFTYIHGEGKVGVMIELGVGNTAPSNDQLGQFGRDVCMHIAAAQPQYVQPSDVPADVIAKEKEIAVAQMAAQNKPQAVLEKIAEGKIKKFYEEVCLIHQPFVKNPDQTIDALTKATGKALGTDLSIKRFTRFVLGDGIAAATE